MDSFTEIDLKKKIKNLEKENWELKEQNTKLEKELHVYRTQSVYEYLYMLVGTLNQEDKFTGVRKLREMVDLLEVNLMKEDLDN